MKYALPDGAHSVAARGREFIRDEKGEIDLTDVDSGTVGDLVRHAGISPALSDEEKAAKAERTAEQADFAARVAEATAKAHAEHLAVAALPVTAAALQAVEDAAAREADFTAALDAVAAQVQEPVAQVGLDPEADAVREANLTRSITPPRRRKA